MASFGQSLQICFLQRNDRTSGLHRALLTNRQYLTIRFDLIEIIDAVCIVLCPFDDNDDIRIFTFAGNAYKIVFTWNFFCRFCRLRGGYYLSRLTRLSWFLCFCKDCGIGRIPGYRGKRIRNTICCRTIAPSGK